MSEETYNVVFTGEIIGGMDPDVAKQNFSNTFKLPACGLMHFLAVSPLF